MAPPDVQAEIFYSLDLKEYLCLISCLNKGPGSLDKSLKSRARRPRQKSKEPGPGSIATEIFIVNISVSETVQRLEIVRFS